MENMTNLPQFLFLVKFCATKLMIQISNRVLDMPSTRNFSAILHLSLLRIPFPIGELKFQTWATWMN